MAWKYIFHSLKSCSRNQIHAKLYHICIYYDSIITGGILYASFFLTVWFNLLLLLGVQAVNNKRQLMDKYIFSKLLLLLGFVCVNEKMTTEHNTIMKCFAFTISELNVIKI